MLKQVCSLVVVLCTWGLLLGGCSKSNSTPKKSDAANKKNDAPNNKDDAPNQKVKISEHIEEFQIPIERMEAPTTVKLNDKLVVKLYGFIGRDSSARFERMEMKISNSKMELKAIGVNDKTPCRGFGQAEVGWRGREFTKNGPHHGPIRIIFHQPDGTTVEKTVEVTIR